MTHQPTDSSPSLSVPRIYLRRRGSKPGRDFGDRLFGRSLSYDLAERALVSEVPPTTPPSCVERADAVLLRLDGTRGTLRGASA